MDRSDGSEGRSSSERLYGLRPLQWLGLAALLQLGLGLLMHGVSVVGWLPTLADGGGRWAFAPDAGETLHQAKDIGALWWTGQWPAAWQRMNQWYVGSAGEFYAIGYILFGPSFFSSIFLNTIVYGLILWIVYSIGATLWDRRAGFWAAAMVGLWPSALLHLTQPIKDPPYILGQLFFLQAMLLLVQRQHRLGEVIRLGAVALVGFGLSSTVRPQVVGINLLMWTAAMLTPIVRACVGRREPLVKYLAMVLLWGVFAHHVSMMLFPGKPWVPEKPVVASPVAPTPTPTPAPSGPGTRSTPSAPKKSAPKESAPKETIRWEERLWRPLAGVLYHRFEWRHAHRESASNIDRDVPLETVGQVLRYLPRALQIGFFAPFPSMWFAEGRRVGTVGRLLSGVEMSVMYLVMGLAMLACWRERRRVEPWVLLGFVFMGILPLGLIVTNVGAIYRMRYAFWFGLMILAVGGAQYLPWRRRQTGRRVDPAPIRIVRIITRTNVGGPALHANFLTSRLDPHRYTSWLVRGSVEAHEQEALEPRGVDPAQLITVPRLHRALHPLDDVRAWWQLYRLIRRLRPHIVHTHMAKAGALGRTAAWVAGVPIIIHTYHGHVLRGYFPPEKERLFLWAERWLARISTRLVVVSTSVRGELLTRRVGSPEQYRVVPLGVDVEPFLACERFRGQLRRELGIDPHDPVIGIVARMVPIKRHEDVLEAARQITTQVPQARFVLVGDGETRTLLEQRVREYHLDGCMRFLGWRQDLDRIYADCDVVVLSSANEGSPVSLIEAMAAGRPIVATSVGGVPDLVEDGATGLLVPVADPTLLAEALLTMIRDPERRSRMGRLGRERVRETYRVERLLKDMHGLYQQLLSSLNHRGGVS